MSTRALIARPDDKHTAIGVYLHHDGYITGAGRLLFGQVRGMLTHPAGPDEAQTRLITKHPAGYRALGTSPAENECYCHDRGEGTTDQFHRGDPNDADWADYTYLLAEDHLEITARNAHLTFAIPWTAEQPDWAWMDRTVRNRTR